VDVGGPDNGYDQFDTIQEGIDAVDAGGTVHVAAGTYLLSATISITKNLSLLGAGEASTFIDGQGSVVVLNTQGLNSTTVIDGFTIQNGSSGAVGGGMYNYQSSPTLINCTFSANTASSNGGGMYNNYYSSPTLINCTFSANTASSNGGGMYNF
jgi:parallel beta-helix repeat protein